MYLNKYNIEKNTYPEIMEHQNLLNGIIVNCLEEAKTNLKTRILGFASSGVQMSPNIIQAVLNGIDQECSIPGGAFDPQRLRMIVDIAFASASSVNVAKPKMTYQQPTFQQPTFQPQPFQWEKMKSKLMCYNRNVIVVDYIPPEKTDIFCDIIADLIKKPIDYQFDEYAKSVIKGNASRLKKAFEAIKAYPTIEEKWVHKAYKAALESDDSEQAIEKMNQD